MVFTKSPSGRVKERIKFQFDFSAEFWDLKPHIQILIDNEVTWSGFIASKKCMIEFFHELELDASHSLALHRSNKRPDQCCLLENGSLRDQYVILGRVIIDDIDIQNLVWDRGWYEPDYPELWRQEQESKGIVLETQVIGETWFSHNGTWRFNFTSPFYKFVLNQFR